MHIPWPIWVGALLIGPLILLLVRAATTWIWSQPHDFRHDGRFYIWMPAKGGIFRLFGRPDEGGTFLYDDGRTVTDPATIRSLQESWRAINRGEGSKSER